MTILIVDDQDQKVNKIKQVISESPSGRLSRVYVNQNVTDAVEFLLQGIPVDLMILDLNMPVRANDVVKEGAGLGVIKEIKLRQELVRPLHVIGLTAADPIEESASRFFASETWALINYDPKLIDWEESISNKIHWISTAPQQIQTILKRKILYFGASPKNLDAISNGTEQRKIEDTLRMSLERDNFEFKGKQGTTFENFSMELMTTLPEFLHLSGHGDEAGVVLEDQDGNLSYIPIDALIQLINIRQGIKCIFINACYSSEQARLLSVNNIYVIGLNGSIKNNVAEAFAVGFYQSIYIGHPVPTAYAAANAHAIVTAGSAGFNNSQLWFAGKPVI